MWTERAEDITCSGHGPADFWRESMQPDGLLPADNSRGESYVKNSTVEAACTAYGIRAVQ